MKKQYTYIRKTFTYDGRQYEVTGKTEAEAYEKIGHKKAALSRGEVGISSAMTVRAWCATYLDTYITPRIRDEGGKKGTKDSLTAKSAAMYRQKLDGYLIPAIGGLRLKDVKAAHLQRVINAQAGKSFSHVNKLMLVTQQIFRRAYLDRLILFDPAEDLTQPNVEKNTRRSLTEQELPSVLRSGRHAQARRMGRVSSALRRSSGRGPAPTGKGPEFHKSYAPYFQSAGEWHPRHQRPQDRRRQSPHPYPVRI